MKKLIWTLCLVIGISSLAYAGSFCCDPSLTKEECCAAKNKMYCPNDNSCRTRCLGVTPPECIGGCINPNGGCCTWCPSKDVCEALGKCQKIGTDGCYTCAECDEVCPSPKCLNQDGKCCDSCPRVCPESQCLVNVDGCYECGECGRGDDDDDDDDDDTETTSPEPDDDVDDDDTETTSPESEPTEPDDDDDETTETEIICDVPLVGKWLGECCDEGTRPCCPSKEDCACYPTKGNCKCEPPKKVSSEGECCPEEWVFVTEIDCEVDGLCFKPKSSPVNLTNMA